MSKTTLTFIALFTLGLIAAGQAQQQESLDVRLTRIEEAIKATNQHIEELSKAFNQRIDDTNKRIDDTNQRLEALRDDINQRLEAGFDRQTNLLITVMGVIAAMSGVVVWFARQDRPISKKQYDKLLQQDEDLGKQFDELAGKNESQNGRLAQHERNMNELTQKLRTLETEIAMLKSPAT
jgi:chromosome segregation ATPase